MQWLESSKKWTDEGKESMQYREFGKLGYKISQLGFGAMRLPTKDGGNVDYNLAVPLIRRALDLGLNFIDSHHFYHNGESETAIGKAINGVREKVYLQTKTPMYREASEDERMRFLETALDKLGTDYIDFFLAHSYNSERFPKEHKAFMKLCRRAKREGMIRHIGFSFHDTAEELKKIIDTGAYECMTVQYNLLNRSLEDMIDYAHEKGMGIVIMGPVGGGTLATPSREIMGMLSAKPHSSAEVALRFVLANKNISLAISGMSNLTQLEENVRIAENKVILSDEDSRNIRAALKEKKRLSDLYCTGCGYCMPCPNGVNIPQNFTIMNQYRLYGFKDLAGKRYQQLDREGKGEGKAEFCVECGQCEPKCPQKIPIMKQLKEVAKTLG